MNKLVDFILGKLIEFSGNKLLFPFYHIVSDSTPKFMKNLYESRRIECFERDLEVLERFFTPISLRDLIKIKSTGNSKNSSYFHLTFDDGLSNFYEIVAPILIKKNIPATVFINTDFVDNEQLFYRFKASLLVEYFFSSDLITQNLFRDFIKNKKTSTSNVSKYLLSIKYDERSILDELAKEVGLDFTEYLENEKPYLSIEQINDLIKEGITFGAHSKDHPLFRSISLNEQIEQTKMSIDWVTNRFDLNYKVFAFPFDDKGISNSYFDIIQKDKVFDLSFGTSGIRDDTLMYNYQRISFEQSIRKIEYYLIIKYIKYYLKKYLE
jgi:peptidoglycan/xylan/chitin deacetylase (PgdA/CDA1 family)